MPFNIRYDAKRVRLLETWKTDDIKAASFTFASRRSCRLIDETCVDGESCHFKTLAVPCCCCCCCCGCKCQQDEIELGVATMISVDEHTTPSQHCGRSAVVKTARESACFQFIFSFFCSTTNRACAMCMSCRSRLSYNNWMLVMQRQQFKYLKLFDVHLMETLKLYTENASKLNASKLYLSLVNYAWCRVDNGFVSKRCLGEPRGRHRECAESINGTTWWETAKSLRAGSKLLVLSVKAIRGNAKGLAVMTSTGITCLYLLHFKYKEVCGRR